MTEEIKEILEEIRIVIDYNEIQNIYKETQLDYDSSKKLLNYITNLQKENEKLKKIEYKFFYCSEDEESVTLDDYLKIGNELYDCEEKLKDYKQRNEKAVEYIEERKNLNWYAEGVFVYELLNILQGGDE